jgi:hypothetical protein
MQTTLMTRRNTPSFSKLLRALRNFVVKKHRASA